MVRALAGDSTMTSFLPRRRPAPLALADFFLAGFFFAAGFWGYCFSATTAPSRREDNNGRGIIC